MNVGTSGGLNLQDFATAAQAAQSPAQQLISKYDNVSKDGKLDQNELVNGGLDSVTAEKLINQLDKNGDKKLSEQEIGEILSKWEKALTEQSPAAAGGAQGQSEGKGKAAEGGAGSSPASNLLDMLLEALMKRADTDKDGKISAEEAQNLGLSEEQFKKADANNDGSLSKEEFGAALLGAASDTGSTTTSSAGSSSSPGLMSISTA